MLNADNSAQTASEIIEALLVNNNKAINVAIASAMSSGVDLVASREFRRIEIAVGNVSTVEIARAIWLISGGYRRHT